MRLCPEDQLLILSARIYFSDQDLSTISQLLKQNLDWDYLTTASIQHSTALLLYNALRIVTDNFNPQHQNSTHLPDGAKAELETLYLNNQPRTERLGSAIAEIFKAFEQQNIAVMVLKEVGLMQVAYPELNLHPIGDLDLLIHKQDFGEVERRLNDLKYRPLPAAGCYYQMTYDAQYQFQRPTDNVWLDIQWDIENKEMDVYGQGSLDFEVDRMWQNARPVQIAGCDALMPSPADLLFHLCLHLEGHGYTELILLTDVAEAIRAYRDESMWDELVALAQKYGVEATVYYVLLWVKTLFQSPIPPQVFEALSPPYFKAHLFATLFENLIPFHSYLDEITLVAAPPGETMAQFETVARRQAVGAMRLYQIVDKIVLAFKATRGQIVILNGQESSIVFPSTALPAFNPLQLIIFANDLPLLTTTLQEQGFEKQDDSFQKSFIIQSKEPALAGHSFNLSLRWQPQMDKEGLFNPERPPAALSKKETAIYMIKNALRRTSKADLDIDVTIEIYALEPEEILAYLCIKAEDEDSKLLASCDILEFFRVYVAQGWSMNWENFLEVINSCQPESVETICNCLIVAYQAVDSTGQTAIEEGFRQLQEKFPEKDLPSNKLRLFTRARFGSGFSARSENFFKNSFFVLLTFLSIEKISAKLAYLWQFIFSTTSEGKSRFNLRQLVLDLISLAPRALGWKKKEDYSYKDVVYWIE